MKCVFEVLEKVKNENSINKKIELLKEGMSKEVELLLRMTYDSNVIFNINKKTVEKYLNINYIDLDSLKNDCISNQSIIDYNILNNIYYLARIKSGKSLGLFLFEIFSKYNIQDMKWVIKSLVKNLEINLGLTSINKIFLDCKLQPIDNLIVQLAKPIYIQNNKFFYKVKKEFKQTDDVKFPCYTEIKYDGMRCVIKIKYEKVNKGVLGFINELNVTLTSRENLDKTNEFPEIVKEVRKFAELNNFNDIILDGEIISSSFSKLQSRFGSSQNNIVKDDKLMFNVFDIREYKSKDVRQYNYLTRLKVIKKFKYTNKVKLAKGKVCKSLTDIKEFYNEACNNKEEGIIIKNFNRTYAEEKCNERKGQWKMKPFDEMDLRVIKFEKGEHIRVINGKIKKVITLGALVCQSDNKEYECNVGSGFTDEERDNIWNNQNNYLNKIVEVGYQDITQKKDSKIYSLRFPTFRRWRFDRNESN